jgi:hypothetical protein
MNPTMAEIQSEIPCEGWWQERGWGRQPMLNLRLKFDAGSIFGSGHDVIGPFTFHGQATTDGKLTMVKQYIGLHAVDYFGTYDGEGLMWGEWHILGTRDQWLIRFRGAPNLAGLPHGITEIK